MNLDIRLDHISSQRNSCRSSSVCHLTVEPAELYTFLQQYVQFGARTCIEIPMVRIKFDSQNMTKRRTRQKNKIKLVSFITHSDHVPHKANILTILT